MLPKQFQPRDRYSRNPFSFIANAGRFIFGFATDEEVGIIKQKLIHLERKEYSQLHHLNRIKNEMSVFVKSTHSKLSELKNQQRQNSRVLSTVIDSLQDWRKNISRKLYGQIVDLTRLTSLYGKLSQIMSQDIQRLVIIEMEFENYLLGIQTLSEGYLPVSLIDPSCVDKAIAATTLALQAKYSDHSVLYKDTFYYYNTNSVAMMHTETNLLIRMRIPIASSPSLLNVFKVYHVPLPVSNMDKGATIVENLSENILVNEASTLYAEMSDIAILSCKGDRLKRCPKTIPMSPREKLT